MYSYLSIKDVLCALSLRSHSRGSVPEVVLQLLKAVSSFCFLLVIATVCWELFVKLNHGMLCSTMHRCSLFVSWRLGCSLVRHQYTPNDYHSFVPLYGKVYIFWKLKNCSFRNYIKGSLIKFVSGRIWTGGRDQHRYVSLTRFFKKRCREIVITCLVCFGNAVKLWELMKHAFSSLK